jgi:N-acetyl-gamma-glutamyl-phosphate reductase
VSAVHTDLVGDSDICFSSEVTRDADVYFLCLDHGESSSFLREHPYVLEKRVIDLSNEFRLESSAHDFVYGLPELNRDRIRTALHIANPGCFATAIQLTMLPLAHHSQLRDDIHVSAVTGSTGAGRKLENTAHFSWRSGNMQVYKAFTHQHLPEIRQSLSVLQPSNGPSIHFIPYRGNFTRGIIASVYTKCTLNAETTAGMYDRFYESHPFTIRITDNPDVKRVVNTNKALLHLTHHDDTLLVVAVIDNLMKGASGQAVQNMNIMFGLDETAGLKTKSVAF